MFISQVTFEAELTEEALLKSIMQGKLAGAQKAPGALSAECWVRQQEQNVAYSLVVHWESKEAFQTWMKNEHQGKPHQAGREGEHRPAIKKSGAQYEVMEL